MSVEHANAFFKAIFGDVDGFIAAASGKQNGKNDLRDMRHRYFPNTDEGRAQAAEYLREQAHKGLDAYHCTHVLVPVDGRLARKKKNAADQVTALWSESDKVRPNGAIPQPSITVESSPGRYHDYWLLDDPIPADKAEELNRRIADLIGADKGWGLSKLLRPPGTFNYKRGKPDEVKVAEYTGELHDPDELDRLLPPLPTTQRTSAAVGDEPPVRLSEAAMRVWRGEDPKLKDNGDVDRSATLMKIGRVLYEAGATRHVIEESLAERDDALPDLGKFIGRPEEYERIVDKLEASGPPHSDTTGDVQIFEHSDMGNAEWLIYRWGHNFRYVSKWGKFLVWDGKRWTLDDSEHNRVKIMAKETVRSMYAAAAKIEDKDERKALIKHAKSSESSGRLQSMVRESKSDVRVMIDHSELDSDPWLFNLNNGTFNLRTGVLQPHNRDDLITQLAPIDYNPEAKAPLFETFIKEILPSGAVRTFVQRLIGYSLNGTTREKVLPILYGTGDNGKSVLLNTVLHLAGDYGLQASNDLLLAKASSHPTELADLFGKRVVTSIETDKGRRLAESLVKQLTGSDRISARRMREDPWNFWPTHTLFLATNHKPEVRGTDNAIWNRLKLIPFTVTIPKNRQDKELGDKLRAELPGILLWALRGHEEWLTEGLGEPDEVLKSTEAYRDEMDALGTFINDMCVTGDPETLRVKAQHLQNAYIEWCTNNSETPVKPREFARQMEGRGFSGGV